MAHRPRNAGTMQILLSVRVSMMSESTIRAGRIYISGCRATMVALNLWSAGHGNLMRVVWVSWVCSHLRGEGNPFPADIFLSATEIRGIVPICHAHIA